MAGSSRANGGCLPLGGPGAPGPPGAPWRGPKRQQTEAAQGRPKPTHLGPPKRGGPRGPCRRSWRGGPERWFRVVRGPRRGASRGGRPLLRVSSWGPPRAPVKGPFPQWLVSKRPSGFVFNRSRSFCYFSLVGTNDEDVSASFSFPR